MPLNLYQILKISENANVDEIKRAYRRLARKYHPDLNKAPGSNEQFRQVNQAYETLSNPRKRQHYDRYGQTEPLEVEIKFDYAQTSSAFAEVRNSFYANFTSSTKPQAAPEKVANKPGMDRTVKLQIDFEQSICGAEIEAPIHRMVRCDHCKGSGAKSQNAPQPCSSCNGAKQTTASTQTPFGTFSRHAVCSTCKGTGTQRCEKCEACSGKKRLEIAEKLKITIPAGVDHGTQLHIAEKGDAAEDNGANGNLIVVLLVKKHATFRRNGVNLQSEVTLSYLDALLGCEVSIALLDEIHTLTVPACTQPHTILTIPHKGVPALGNPHCRGDVLVEIIVRFPDQISNEEKLLLTEIARLQKQ